MKALLSQGRFVRAQLVHDIAISRSGLQSEAPAKLPRIEGLSEMRYSLRAHIAESVSPTFALPALGLQIEEENGGE